VVGAIITSSVLDGATEMYSSGVFLRELQLLDK
jgi:hypothetical protein